MTFAKFEASAAEIWMAEVVAAASENRLRFLAERPGNYAEALRDLVEHADTFVVIWRDGVLPGGNDLAVLKGTPMIGKVDIGPSVSTFVRSTRCFLQGRFLRVEAR